MSIRNVTFLPGVPKEHVLHRLRQAGADQIGSGQLAHHESSAALAVNVFGWFVSRCQLFPAMPGTEGAGAASRIEVEYAARFPWSGGKQSVLDAAVITETHLIGVQAKRYEPFRETERSQFGRAYDRPAWGTNMERYHGVRHGLMDGSITYQNLDAAELIKQAYGLVTEAKRLHKAPLLHYIFAEPDDRGAQPITAADRWQHRAEIADFQSRIAGDEVSFSSCSYREWIETWEGSAREHALNLIKMFKP